MMPLRSEEHTTQDVLGESQGVLGFRDIVLSHPDGRGEGQISCNVQPAVGFSVLVALTRHVACVGMRFTARKGNLSAVCLVVGRNPFGAKSSPELDARTCP